MAEFHYYLRDPLAERTTIYAFASYYGHRVKISTDIKIPSKFWNSRKELVKELMEFKEYKEINSDLMRIKEVMKTVYENHRAEGVILNPKQFRDEFRASKDSPIIDKKINTFWDHFEDFVSAKRNQLSDVKDYHYSLRKHLTQVELKMKRPLTFLLIKDPKNEFIINWERYLKFEALNAKGEKGMSLNTVGKQNKNLKVFLNWSFDNGHYERFTLKRFPTLMEEVDNIYMTEAELVKLMGLELEDVKERKVRDLFIMGCETGLRFSDFMRMNIDHINDGYLTFSPKKTSGYSNNKIIIPVSERFSEVLKRNGNDIPKLGNETVTYFNQIIRTVCEKAEFKKEVKYQREVSGKMTTEIRYRYQEVSSHTCRRTFCTLKFLKGMPAQAIMKFSGHRTERNFLKYLKLDAELTARKYGEYF
jgi:integrase